MFSSYDANELREILRNRTHAFEEGALTDTVDFLADSALSVNIALAGVVILLFVAMGRDLESPRAKLIWVATMLVPLVSMSSYAGLASGLTVGIPDDAGSRPRRIKLSGPEPDVDALDTEISGAGVLADTEIASLSPQARWTSGWPRDTPPRQRVSHRRR